MVHRLRRPGLGPPFATAAVSLATLALAAACAVWPTSAGARVPNSGARIAAGYALPTLAIAEVQNAVLPGSVSNDHRIPLGGIGSDLFRAPSDPAGEFWMVTDRGPNGEVKVKKEERRTFPVPEFTPMILKARTEPDGNLGLLQTIPIVGQSGQPVTGLFNLAGPDGAPWDLSGQSQLGYNPSGLDTEGLVRTSVGEFWLADEYGPSIVRVDPGGRVLKRFVPEGVALGPADYPVAPSLPAIYARRRPNRGFEGLALSPDERSLFAVLQSPLGNPDLDTGETSRNTRLLVFDPIAEQPTAEYLYRFEPAASFGADGDPDEMKLSGVVALSPTTLLILERTDQVARVFLVDLAAATNILATRWDRPTVSPSLEALEHPREAGVQPVAKRLLVDLSALPDVPEKIEGLAVVDPTTLAIANDNDFDFTAFDAAGNAILRGIRNRLILVQLDAPLP